MPNKFCARMTIICDHRAFEALQPHLHRIGGRHLPFGIGNSIYSKMEYARGQHRVRTAARDAIDEVLQLTSDDTGELPLVPDDP